MANYAIASLSYLAANYEKEGFKANSQTIATARNLSRPLVGKLMSQMSTAGLVNGTPGPGGGFFLSRPPSEITLLEIVRLFEKVEESLMCPFGPGWCGNGDPCPFHYELEDKRDEMMSWLSNTNLEVFTKHPIKPDRGYCAEEAK
ncbi:Rrf2 family transcriptional regulator [Pelagicoccus sp. SDUM812005]|uniref:RrF2 family transcriptional regulator n=1 Tax=Pelagicoccus sp. SDUM812005 TaxID=3041257 RepID=UPI00280F8B2D|nr:Rrf2 family transcriptional regulator [Pelagicoccus sp. SDUM812005]MDQ8179876.1 Rrf2 family transcriptional regulator [Pelagicoccus sp. SDUM812005]